MHSPTRRHFLRQKARWSSSLQSRDKERYAEKLAVLYGSHTDSIDPFDIPDDKWVDDIFLWPPVEYGDVYTYLVVLVDTPGQFTREKLKARKSLDAFNYYIR